MFLLKMVAIARSKRPDSKAGIIGCDGAYLMDDGRLMVNTDDVLIDRGKFSRQIKNKFKQVFEFLDEVGVKRRDLEGVVLIYPKIFDHQLIPDEEKVQAVKNEKSLGMGFYMLRENAANTFSDTPFLDLTDGCEDVKGGLKEVFETNADFSFCGNLCRKSLDMKVESGRLSDMVGSDAYRNYSFMYLDSKRKTFRKIK